MSKIFTETERSDIDCVMHPYTNMERHKESGPFIIERGEGVWVYDTQGNRYIEGMAGLWCLSLGYGQERLINAATEQLKKLPYYHLFNSKSMNPAIQLAEKLLQLSPVKMSKVFFSNSGSEANDTAVKLVWYYNNSIGRTKKKKIISRFGGYHGVTVASASLTGIPTNHTDFDLPIAGILHTDCPHYYRYAQEGESEEQFASRLADRLESLIIAEGPETVAAFIAEPIMGGGGVILPPKTYFQKVQTVLKKYDVLMIVDEVICGFGRTGSMFGSQTFNIEPDIMTMAKGLSSAYLPISAVLVNDNIASEVTKNSGKVGIFGHGYTYSGHPVSSAVALEALSLYEDLDILTHVNSVSIHLQGQLRALRDHPLVGDVRGVGLIAGVELVADKKTRKSFNPKMAVAANVVECAKKHGVILRSVAGDTISFSPPLIIKPEEINFLVEGFTLALNEVMSKLD